MTVTLQVLAGAVVILLAFAVVRYGLKVRRRRAINRILRERLTEIEQKRKAWSLREGDGIRPVRERFR